MVRTGFSRVVMVSIIASFTGGSSPVFAEAPSQPPGRADLALPSDLEGGEIVSPYGTDVPPACQAFLAAAGGDWFLAWDRSLETPRLAFPSRPLPLFDARGEPLAAAGGATLSESIAGTVAAFIDAHREFLGVRAADLSRLAVIPLDDGLLVNAHQIHEGLPVRGSAFRIRLDASSAIRSINCRLARHLPPIEPAVLSQLDAAALTAAEGIEFPEDGVPHLQVAFPGGIDGAKAAWAAHGRDASGDVELLLSATSGEKIALRRMTLGFTVEGSAHGFCPPPEDVFAIPSRFDASNRNPLSGILAIATGKRVGGGIDVRNAAGVSPDGSFTVALDGADDSAPVDVRLLLRSPGRFHVSITREEVEVARRGPANLPFEMLFNESLTEFGSLQVMAYLHVKKGFEEIDSLIRLHGLFQLPFPDLDVFVRNDVYVHSYNPNFRSIMLGNDEIQGAEPSGRLRKMVPTIMYHEQAHSVFHELTTGISEESVHEGIADAMATYLGRVSTIGFVDPSTPNADIHSRDLLLDRTAFPDSPRQTVAGAFRELWEATLDPLRPGEGQPSSSFAFGLMLRWLASKRVEDGVFHGALPVEFHPLLGAELFVEADDPAFSGGDNDLANGIPNQDELVRAFGRRNIFPLAFIRGDANGDAGVDISDALRIFGVLFLGQGEADCADAMDADDSGSINISDGIALLNHLFSGGVAPDSPFPSCGWDTTGRDGLGCGSSPCGYFPEKK
jgi:hypothetical protein